MVQISATAAACRVFVRSNPCVFGNSVFDEIFKGCEDPQRRHCDHYDRGLVSLEEKDGKVHLSTAQKDKRCVTALPMGRAKDCPSLGSTPCPTTVNRKIVEKTPFVGLAVVGLVLDSTGEHLLITRRPSYMRAFPGAWVFPGGGVDLQESLICAVSREISEETGLHTGTTHDCWKLESVWESVYPTKPGLDIRAHHIVVYLSTKLTFIQELQLCQEEVDAAVWLSRENVLEILANSTRKYQKVEEYISRPSLLTTYTTPKRENAQIPLSDIVGIYPQPSAKHGKPEWSGLAQGSLFALEEFWSSTWGSPTN